MSADTGPGPALRITPEPTDDEAAAIAAAAVVAIGGGGPEPLPETPSRWRFSGRWWSQPVSARRVRP